MSYTSPRFTNELITKFKDRSGERAGASIYVPEDFVLVDANGNGVPEGALPVAWYAALQSITDGLIVGSQVSQNLVESSALSGSGQREHRYLVTYVDNITGNPGRFEVPTRDTTILPPIDTDLYDLTAGPWPAFKSALEGFAVSKLGNPITLWRVKLIGSRS